MDDASMSMQNSNFVTGSQSEAKRVATLPGFSDMPLDDEINSFFQSDMTMFEQKLRDLDSRLGRKRLGNVRIARERLLLEKYCDEIMLSGERLLMHLNNRKTAKQVKQHFRKMISHWISKGARASNSAHNLLIAQKVITGKTVNVVRVPRVPAPATSAA